MEIINIFCIVLCATFFFNSIIAQDSTADLSGTSQPPPIINPTGAPVGGTGTDGLVTEGGQSTPPPTPPTPPTEAPTPKPPTCPNGEFPLFGPSSCISRSAYTGIFLSSIILAGISFLLLLGILGWLLVKRFTGDSGSDEESSIGNAGGYKKSPIIKNPSSQGGSRQNANSTKNVPVSTSRDEPSSKRKNQDSSKLTSPTPRDHLSAPYTDARPVSPSRKSPTRKPADPSDKPARPSRRTADDSSQNPPRPQHRQATSPNGPTAESRRTHKRREEKNESSQF